MNANKNEFVSDLPIEVVKEPVDIVAGKNKIVGVLLFPNKDQDVEVNIFIQSSRDGVSWRDVATIKTVGDAEPFIRPSEPDSIISFSLSHDQSRAFYRAIVRSSKAHDTEVDVR